MRLESSGSGRSTASIQTRNLSAGGDRVFFETPDKLVASDTNGDGRCEFCEQSSWRWRYPLLPGCIRVGGRRGRLVRKRRPKRGLPVFAFDRHQLRTVLLCRCEHQRQRCLPLTVQSLVGQDTDQIRDIYDASVNGGIASQNPPTPPPSCEGEACKGPVAVPPASESAGSASFSEPVKPKPSHHNKRRHRKKKQHKKPHTSRKDG